MLVRFRSDAGSVILFGDVGVALLKMMGQSGVLPGALLARDIPPALERLKQAVAQAREAPAPGPREPEDEVPVSVRQRAFPLIELLERCAKKGCDVIWEGISRA